MKQKTTLTRSRWLFACLLSLLMTLGGSSPAWGETLTIYESATSTTSYEIPIYAYNCDGNGNQSEFVVPSSMLTSMAGKNITAISFYCANFSWATNIPRYKVYMKEVASATLSSYAGDTDATTVYTGELSVTAGVMTITFSTPYEYAGGHLLVGTKVVQTGSWVSKDNSKFYGSTDSDVTCSRSSDGNKYFIPKTTFTYESATVEGPGFAVKDGSTKLSSPYAYSFGLTTAGTTKTFKLTNPGTAATPISVDVSGANGFTAAVEDNATSIPAGGEKTLTITMPNATASGSIVVTPTGDGLSAFTFNVSGTAKDPSKLWCDFTSDLPSGWDNTGGWAISNSGADGITSGGGYASNTSYDTNKRMFTPLVTIAEGEKLYLMVKGYGATASWNKLYIQYSANGTDWTTAKSLESITNTWQSVEVTEIPAGNWYIGFYGSYVYITDIYGGTESTAPVLSLSQSSYDFGLINENTTSAAITITNTGKSALTGLSLASSSPFSTTITGGVTEIAGNGGTATFTVTMAATTKGYSSSNITINSDNADPIQLAVSGAVAKDGTTTAVFNDATLAGWTKSGNTSFNEGETAAYFYYTYTNYLTSPKVTIVADDFLAVNAKMASDYGYVTVQGSIDGSSWTDIKKLDSGELNQADYTTAIVSGISTDYKYLRLNGYYCYVKQVAGLTYAPVLVVKDAEDAVQASPVAYAFGEQGANASVTYSFTNGGAGTLNITNVAVTNTPDDGTYTTNWTESVATPFDLVITQNYDAEKTGAKTGSVVVTMSDASTFTINLSGTLLAANAPTLSVSTNAIDFGKVTANAVQTVTVTNTGTGSMDVTIASDNAAFELSATSLTGIGAGESKTFNITFKYGTPYGVKNGNVTVTPTYNAEAARVITVTGKAKDPATWSEDFSGGTLPTGWDAGADWTIDEGKAKASYYHGSTYSHNDNYLVTPPLTVSGTSDELTFDYEVTGTYVTITIQQSKDGGAWETCTATPTLNSLDNGAAGTATITGLEAGSYQFRFKNDDYNLDNFEGFVLNLPDHMATITASSIPESPSWDITMKQGKSFDATVTVKEQRGVAEELTAKLYMGDEVIGTKAGSVSAKGTETLTITCTPTVAAPEGAQMHIEVEWAGTKMTTDNVTRYVAALNNLTLNEESSDAIVAGTYDNLTLKRKFTAGWNTVCLPFDITNIETFFGTGAKAYNFTSYSEGTLGFTSENSLAASYPYVVYVPTAITEDIELTDITIDNNDTEGWYTSFNSAYFRGTYVPIAAGDWTKKAGDDKLYGVTAAGKIAKIGDAATSKGFRGYFDLPAGATARLSFFDETTGITTVMDAKELNNDGKVYNLNGQRVENAHKGLYIVNGRKVVVK